MLSPMPGTLGAPWSSMEEQTEKREGRGRSGLSSLQPVLADVGSQGPRNCPRAVCASSSPPHSTSSQVLLTYVPVAPTNPSISSVTAQRGELISRFCLSQHIFLSICVAQDKSLHLSELQFSHLWNKNNKDTSHTELLEELNEITQEGCLAHAWHMAYGEYSLEVN